MVFLGVGGVRPEAYAQTTLYWDVNGTAAGATDTTVASGQWNQNTTANWTINSGGTSATGTWQALSGGAGIATFSSGTDATGTSTVTVGGTVSGLRGITFEDGLVNVTGGTLALGGNATITTNASAGAIASNITGAFSVTHTGAGQLTLSGANTFTGGFALQSGRVQVGSDAALGTGTLTISGGTLQATGGSHTLANQVAVNGNFTIGGSSDLTLGGAVMLNSGNRTITVANTGVTTISGQLATQWYATTTKLGSGTLVLSGANNSFTGPIAVNAGALELRNNAALGGSTSGNTVASGAELRLNGGISVAEGGFTLQGTGMAGGGVLRNVAGANTLTAQVVFGGPSTVGLDAGTLTLAGSVDLSAGGTLTTSGAGNAVFASQVYGTGALVHTGSGNVTFSNTISTSGSLTLNGTGAVTLSGGNANSGGAVVVNSGTLLLAKNAGTTAIQSSLTINGGIVRLGAANQLADYLGVTLVGATALLDLNNFNETIASLAFTGGSVTTGSGLLSVSGTGITTNASATAASLTGNLALAGGATTVAVADGAAASDLSIGAAISGAGGIMKSGSGILTLSGVNTFTGATTISQGTIQLNGGNLGNATSIITVNDANTLTANTALLLSSAGTLNRAITIANLGTGTTTLGSDTALASGAVGFTGNVSLGRNTAFQAAGNTMVTFDTGVISGAGGITATGGGTLALGGVNTYTGATTVSQGLVVLRNSSALGTATTTVTVNDGNTGSASTGLLIGTSGVTLGRSVTVANAGTGSVLLGGHAALSAGTAAFTGAVTLNRNVTLNASGTSTVTFSGAIGGTGAITKTGTGTLALSSPSGNTFTGGVTVTQGTLAASVDATPQFVGAFASLGSFSALTTPTTIVTVNEGATLSVHSTYTGSAASAPTQDKQILSLSGSGYGGAGALRATGGVNSWLGSIELGGDTTITNTGVAGAGADVLYLGPWTTNVAPLYLNLNNHALTLNGTGNIAITESIGNAAGDSGSVTLNGASTTRYTFAGLKNYYTGATNVNSGVLRLSIDPGGGPGLVTANSAILGDLKIGTGSATTTATVQLSFSNQIADAAHVTINSDGVLDLGTYGKADVVGQLTLNGGTVSLSSPTNNGTLSLGADVNVTGAMTSNISATSTSAGLDLNNLAGPARTFDVAAGSTLNVTAKIVGGSLIKDGAGTMILAGDSTTGYAGTTEVRNGILSVRHQFALGKTNNGTEQAAQTLVSSGATLQLQSNSGDLTYAPEALVINGAGSGGIGALQNVAGNNTWTGGITLGSNSTINANSGTSFRINGTIDGTAATGSSQTLTVGGLGNTTLVGPIGDGANGGVLNLRKTDSSTLTLGNVNSFRGTVSVEAGMLASATTDVFGSHQNIVAVASGATLSLSAPGTVTIAGLRNGSIGGGVVSIAGGTTLQVNNTTDDRFDGRLNGAGLFEKMGSGTLTFGAAGNNSSFAIGGMTLDAGTLAFEGGSAANSLSITNLTLNGGTLLLSGAYIKVDTLTITADTILDFGADALGASTLFATNIYVASTATLRVRNWASEVDYLYANGQFRLDSASGTLAQFNQQGAAPENRIWFTDAGSGSTDGAHTAWTNNWAPYTNHEIRPVPEPAAYGAILAGLSSLLVAIRRRRNR